MSAVFERIYKLATQYLDTRENDVHTAISLRFAFELLEKEGGEEDIVIPAIILHDVGWKRVPPELQLRAFGPRATSPELNRIHETAGVEIAKRILQKVNYDRDKMRETLEIIHGHDSRKKAISLNDKVVKDADKLWRYSKEGFYTDVERFKETYAGALERVRFNVDRWFYTESARELAMEEIRNRVKEAKGN
jgi:HD superfamily phosphodiesterase